MTLSYINSRDINTQRDLYLYYDSVKITIFLMILIKKSDTSYIVLSQILIIKLFRWIHG